ncbi:hypothetical protein PVAND_000982 [Polypedilum vanderplanki]|uniref:Partial AB-hydrolase lipase domain-containing protein n=1 Tax=Polypedilum vanderplanki TaxID=319348 RepID=A0A9J6BLK0_POLVA|nr:hypothetical protein PVAND_000982 [Polypedilum vanderplanki]
MCELPHQAEFFQKFLNPLNWIPKIPEVPWNPDSELTTPEIIVRHGYQAETHTVQTEDGYLLNMHRIPCGRAGCSDEIRQPVFYNMEFSQAVQTGF